MASLRCKDEKINVQVWVGEGSVCRELGRYIGGLINQVQLPVHFIHCIRRKKSTLKYVTQVIKH